MEGAFEDWQGHRLALVSDGSWRVSDHQEWQPNGGPWWYDVDFKDDHWVLAQELPNSPITETAKVLYNPLIWTKGMAGQWIWSPSITSENAYFRKRMSIPHDLQEAWIRISAGGGFRLMVNGQVIGSYSNPLETLGGAAPTRRVLMYDVTPFLQSGLNVLAVSTSKSVIQDGLLLDGVVIAKNRKPAWFATPDGWKTATVPSPGWSELGYDDRGWDPAQPLDHFSSERNLGLKKIIAMAQPSDGYRWSIMVAESLWVMAVALVVLWYWRTSANILARINSVELRRALNLQALAFALPTAFLLFLFLLRYDIRFNLAYPFQTQFILITLGLVLLVQLLLSTVRPATPQIVAARPTGEIHFPRLMEVCGVVLLLMAGFWIRLQAIDHQPLGGDEVTMAMFTQGVLAKGYPHFVNLQNLSEKILTTSESVPYFMALSAAFFEPIELALRLPGVFWGTLTLGLLYWMGKTLFDQKVGLLSAIIYLVLPSTIEMAHYARYPSQLQFFVLLTAYFLYRAVSPTRLNTRFLYLTLGCFIMCFLSWEGVLLFSPALLVGIVALKRTDLSWLKSQHVWIAGGILACVVFLQFSFRLLANTDRMGMGLGVSQISLVPLWLQPLFDPFSVFRNLLFFDYHHFIGVLALAGLPLCRTDKPLAYILTLLLTPLVVVSGFIETQSFRHVYYVLPFLLLAGAKGCLWLLDGPKRRILANSHSTSFQ